MQLPLVGVAAELVESQPQGERPQQPAGTAGSEGGQRKCRICQETKPQSEFYIRSDDWGSRPRTECKVCRCILSNERWKKNPQAYQAWLKSRRVKRPKLKTGPKPKWTREQKLARHREYNMRPEVAAKRKAGYEKMKKDPEKLAEMRRRGMQWFMENKPATYAYRNARRRANPHFQISSNLRTYIYQRVGKRTQSGQSRFRQIVGISIADFCSWLESHFHKGMTWQNYGRGNGKWSIDHTRPCASFDLTDPAQVAICFHYSNMKPMWWLDNIRKSDTFSFSPGG